MRTRSRSVRVAILGLAATLTAAPLALAQSGPPTPPASEMTITVEADEVVVLVPQRPVHRRPHAVHVTKVDAEVSIEGPVARTRLSVTVANPGPRPAKAELVVPVPDAAAIRAFGLEGLATDSDGEPTARLLPRAEARRIFDEIVRRMIDPGLLEFAGHGLIRSSVFPVPANGTQVFHVSYEQLLESDAGRTDYVLPRSTALDQAGADWHVRVTVSPERLGAIWSPSHELTIRRGPAGPAFVTIAPESMREPGALRLSIVRRSDDAGALSTSILAYPDPRVGDGRGGYFLLLLGAPELRADGGPSIPREVTVVIDRSGSMRGAKIEQATAAALQVIEALDDGELFNVIDYSDTIESFSAAPVVKSDATVAAVRAYLENVKALGGTNLHDALVEALRQPPTEGTLPLVLFLTDGLPTIGERSEAAIRAAAEAGNRHERRIFSFGVGFDVNAPLLTGLARDSRATSTFVLPEEDVEVKVASVFRKLSGPALASPEVRFALDDDVVLSVPVNPVREVLPATLPDLFSGEQVVVLGRYVQGEPIRVTVRGDAHGADRVQELILDPDAASVRFDYVPRLWAQRRIAALLEQIRLDGAGSGRPVVGGGAPDPSLHRELVDEIVALSLEYGILTEYTAFLAAEDGDVLAAGGASFGARLGAPGAGGGAGAGLDVAEAGRAVQLARESASLRVQSRAVEDRAGQAAVSQELNLYYLGTPSTKMAQRWLDEDMNEVLVTSCQNVADKTMFRGGGRWIDAALVQRAIAAGADAPETATIEPEETVEFGTDAYFALVDRLIEQRRQALLAIPGELLLDLDGRCVLVKNPA